MATFQSKSAGILFVLLCALGCSQAVQSSRISEGEFGPVVRAYLGYLRNEQEVVDDRVSRREISAGYYRRNSNRIKALRQMAVKLARDSHNDYLPELEAVAGDEFGLLFEHRPALASLRAGAVLQNTFRFLGMVRSGEPFYVLLVWIPMNRLNSPKKRLQLKRSRRPCPSIPNLSLERVASRPRYMG